MTPQALQPGQQIAQATSIPAPTGGLNGRDSLANMPPTDAVLLENWFPLTTSVQLRNGYSTWQAGVMSGWVETLMSYKGLTTKKLFAIATDNNIYDVTVSGGTPSSVFSGLSNARWQYTNVGTSGGQFIIAVNGKDPLMLYNGTAWQAVTGITTPAITGVATTSLSNVTVFKQRVYFIQSGTAVVWFLAAGAITGAASSMDLTQLLQLGGYLVAMATWTIDTVAGVNEYAAFISSEGEVLLYNGTDPTSASTWVLAARFRIGRPIGSRCWIKVAGDAYVLCVDGVYPLSKALLQSRAELKDAISDKIRYLLQADIQNYSGNFGWQMMLHPMGQKLIVNVPYAEDNTQYQYVMNTITQAWTRFTGWNAACWEVQGDSLYFGGNGAVYLADTGQTDNSSNIQTKAAPAFSYFGSPGLNKYWRMVRPVIQANGTLNPTLSLNTDFKNLPPVSTPTFFSLGSPWDTSPWDTSSWSSNTSVIPTWQTVGGIGKCATIYMYLNAQNISVNWMSTDYVYQQGGIL